MHYRYLSLFRFFLIAAAMIGLAIFVPTQSLAAMGQQYLPAAAASDSLNWSGYVAQGGTYTSVMGSWVVPAVHGTGATGTADATWVGIGGSQSRDLLQAGTQALVSKSGAVTYEAWYELLPDYSTPVSLAVHPGDSITTTITEQSPGQWLIAIRNNTTGTLYQKTVAYTSQRSSAEWVEEMVSNGDGSFRPLDNFGTVTFTSAAAVANGQLQNLSQLNAQPITMMDDFGDTLASASELTGSGFSVTRSARTPAAPAPSQLAGAGHYIIFTISPSGVREVTGGSDATSGTAPGVQIAPRGARHTHHRGLTQSLALPLGLGDFTVNVLF